MKPIGTLIVDDNPKFLEAAKRFLSSDPMVELIGTAVSGQEALDIIQDKSPDLVIIDLAMPGLDGLEVTRQVKTQFSPPPQVVILTLYDNEEYRSASRLAGADGFVAKSDIGTHLIPQIYDLFEVGAPVSNR
jgi:DNA-binding NarL/FixJ family response regulator